MLRRLALIAVTTGLVASCGASGDAECVATDAVSSRASSGSITEALWFRFVVRTGLALLAFWALSFAQVRYRAFVMEFSAQFRHGSLWLSWAGVTIAAGLLFRLATWLPFAKIRFLPSRLLLAAVALLPLAVSGGHTWRITQRRAGGWGGSTGSTRGRSSS